MTNPILASQIRVADSGNSQFSKKMSGWQRSIPVGFIILLGKWVMWRRENDLLK